jgi:hypothetical protein
MAAGAGAAAGGADDAGADADAAKAKALAAAQALQEEIDLEARGVSYRSRFYAATDGSARVIRVMYSNLNVPGAVEHCFAALANLWLAGQNIVCIVSVVRW